MCPDEPNGLGVGHYLTGGGGMSKYTYMVTNMFLKTILTTHYLLRSLSLIKNIFSVEIEKDVFYSQNWKLCVS